MGLAGPKENTKIGKDPRNTFWSRDTSRFGHRYLSDLGWTPGQNLGDNTSSYHTSGHITDASSAGVKILLKDDNLGIGAKKGAQHDECTGLLGLQGLLGRLNGNEVQVEQARKEEDRQKNDWIKSKWGMKFVKGETWVADDLTKLRERVLKDKEAREGKIADKKGIGIETGSNVDEEEEKEVKQKKRKRDAGEEKSTKRSTKSKSKDKEKSKRRNTGDEVERSSGNSESRQSKSTSASTVVSGDEMGHEVRRRKREEKRSKKDRKERRRRDRIEKKERKKEKEQRERQAPSGSDGPSDSETESSSAATTRSVTPASAMNGRHALRARFIAAKRSAMMDSTSLNEIFMIKA